MFIINEDMSIYVTRGDAVAFSVAAEANNEKYTFAAGDVVRLKVFEKKGCHCVVLQKDFPVTETAEKVDIFLTKEETKIGEIISKPKDYWYEVELNPYDAPQTIIGYDDEGAKVFKLLPEGGDNAPPYIQPAGVLTLTGAVDAVYDGTAPVTVNIPVIAGESGKDGADGVSVTHEWDGTVLKVTSASGTTSADLKGEKGEKGDTGAISENGAGAHNAIYRGKFLGNTVTDAQWAAIKAGTFEDLYIGDYWELYDEHSGSSVCYRIAAFDYYLSGGGLTTHHVTLVPDTMIAVRQMNANNTTSGAYVGSYMYKSVLPALKSRISGLFGANHMLHHNTLLPNAVTSGYESGYSWYDSTVELMTEHNVYGGKIFKNARQGSNFANNYTVDKSQFPLFAFRPDLIIGSNDAFVGDAEGYWLRDVASATYFCYVNRSGSASCLNASAELGVRPAFSIC